MERSQVLTLVRLGSIVLVVAAMGAAALDLVAAGNFDPTRFFAFFTIQSNIIGVVAFAWLLAGRSAPRSRALDLLRGAAVVYLTVTFFVVIFLLSGADVQLDLVWVDFVLHKYFPVVVLLDWILDPPQFRLTVRDALLWLIYPIVWVMLTMIRGARSTAGTRIRSWTRPTADMARSPSRWSPSPSASCSSPASRSPSPTQGCGRFAGRLPARVGTHRRHGRGGR